MHKSEPTSAMEIVVMDRRLFLRVAGGALVSITGLGLFGCAGSGMKLSTGGGGTNPPPAFTKISATVNYPGKVPANLALLVSNAANKVKVAPNLSFSLNILASAPSHVVVTDANGNAVFFGFLDPTRNNQIGPTSTAVALIYFMLGGSSFYVDDQRIMLEGISQDRAVAPLAAVITSRLLANPTALAHADPQILHAVLVACQSIVAESPAYLPAKPTVARPLAGRSVAAKSAGLAKPRTAAGTITIEPLATQLSGTEIFAATDNAGVTGSNFYRFERSLFVYKTGHVDAAGKTTEIDPPLLIGTKTALEATAQLSLSVSLKTIVGGAVPWLPTSTAEIPLTIDSGDEQTLYDVVMIGPGAQQFGSGTALPAFFSDAKYAEQVPEWKTEANTLMRKTIFLYLLSLILDFAGLTPHGHGTFGFGQGIAIDNYVDAMNEISDPTWQKGIDEVFEGHFLNGIISLLTAVTTTEAVASPFFSSVLKFMSTYYAGTIASSLLIQYDALAVLETVVGVLHLAGAGLVFADCKNLNNQIGASNIGELYGVTLSLTSLTLTPSNPTIAAGTSVSFNLSLIGVFVPPGATLSLTWTQSGGAAGTALFNGTGTGSTSLITPSENVSILTVAAQTAPIAITVSVVLQSGGSSTNLGSAQTTIFFKGAPVTISLIPEALSVKPGATSSVITALTKALIGTGTSGEGRLLWSIYPASLGTLSAGTSNTVATTTTFTAGHALGNGVVECRYIDNATGSELGSATMQIMVQTEPTIVFGNLMSGGHYDKTGRYFWGIWVSFPLVPNATAVSMHCYNFDDTAYFGTSIYASGTYARGVWYWSNDDINPDSTDAGPAGKHGRLFLGLTGGSGPGSGNLSNDNASTVAYMNQRFHGMIVQATYQV